MLAQDKARDRDVAHDRDVLATGPRELVRRDKIITKSGDILKHTFDPSILANFQDAFNSSTHRQWQPIFKTDMKLNKSYDFFSIIVGRVKGFNESYDMTIVGDRGLGKSAFGLSAATIINARFAGKRNTPFPLDNVCFDVESWIELTDSLSGKGGGVVILDEVGTEGSLSSRTSMSQGNRATSDIIQLMRTDKIITIYISVDRNRIDKRVRELTSIMGTPIGKLNDEDTNGYGLAVEADIRYRRTRPSVDDASIGEESGYLVHEVSQLHYAPKGTIFSVVVPHPGMKSWKGYEARRAGKLADVRDSGFVAYDGAGAGAMVNEIVKMRKEIDKQQKKK